MFRQASLLNVIPALKRQQRSAQRTRKIIGKTSANTEPESKFSAHRILKERPTHSFTEPRFNVLPQTRYGGINMVTLIAGAGIGPEIVSGVKQVLDAARAPIVFEEIDMGPSDDIDKCNADFAQGIMSIRRNGVALKGNIENLSCDPADYSRNIALRRNLDLYANVVEYKTYPGITTRHGGAIDMVIVRQNTEGEYLMLEHEPVPGVVENMKIVTSYNTARTARFAFEYARRHGRKSIMTVHRAHVLTLGDGMFAKTARKVAEEYPDIEYSENSVAYVVKRLTIDPLQFDVLLTTNLYGSIFTNMMFGYMGSPALMSGKNYGDKVAVFETGHRGKGESMTGKGIANPTAMLNATIGMLHYLGHDYHACLINEALELTINEDCIHTFDIGGPCTTQDVIDNVIRRLADIEADICPFPEDCPPYEESEYANPDLRDPAYTDPDPAYQEAMAAAREAAVAVAADNLAAKRKANPPKPAPPINPACAKLHEPEPGQGKVDCVKGESEKVDCAKGGSEKVDCAKGESEKVDCAKGESEKVDCAKGDANKAADDDC